MMATIPDRQSLFEIFQDSLHIALSSDTSYTTSKFAVMAAAQKCAPITPNLPALPLPEGITSSYIHTPALTYHILSSGAPTKENPTKKPLILLLHGFPELAYSWRKVLVPLSQISRLPQVPFLDEDGEAYLRDESDQGRENNDLQDGYHVVAYDQRGYEIGRASCRERVSRLV